MSLSHPIHLKKQMISVDLEPVDLTQSPVFLSSVFEEEGHDLLGDLHGNAIKLIHFLIRKGLLKLKPNDEEDPYQTLFAIYKNFNAPGNKQKFLDLLNNATWSNKGNLHLIGDILGDRGAGHGNDFMTLAVLKKIKDSGVQLNINFSNHDAGFLADYFKTEPAYYSTTSPHLTLTALGDSIKKGIVDRKEVIELVEGSYLPSLKLIDYIHHAHDKTLTILTHAPNGLETIKALAALYYVDYQATTADALKNTIDEINQKFYFSHFNGMCRTQLEHENIQLQTAEDYKHIAPSSPLSRTIWSQIEDEEEEEEKDEKEQHKTSLPHFEVPSELLDGTKLIFVHGHIGPRKKNLFSNMVNIDSNAGKDDFESEDERSMSLTGVGSKPLSQLTPARKSELLAIRNLLPCLKSADDDKKLLEKINQLFDRIDKSNLTTSELTELTDFITWIGECLENSDCEPFKFLVALPLSIRPFVDSCIEQFNKKKEFGKKTTNHLRSLNDLIESTGTGPLDSKLLMNVKNAMHHPTDLNLILQVGLESLLEGFPDETIQDLVDAQIQELMDSCLEYYGFQSIYLNMINQGPLLSEYPSAGFLKNFLNKYQFEQILNQIANEKEKISKVLAQRLKNVFIAFQLEEKVYSDLDQLLAIQKKINTCYADYLDWCNKNNDTIEKNLSILEKNLYDILKPPQTPVIVTTPSPPEKEVEETPAVRAVQVSLDLDSALQTLSDALQDDTLPGQAYRPAAEKVYEFINRHKTSVSADKRSNITQWATATTEILRTGIYNPALYEKTMAPLKDLKTDYGIPWGHYFGGFSMFFGGIALTGLLASASFLSFGALPLALTITLTILACKSTLGGASITYHAAKRPRVRSMSEKALEFVSLFSGYQKQASKKSANSTVFCVPKRNQKDSLKS